MSLGLTQGQLNDEERQGIELAEFNGDYSASIS